MSRSRFEAQIRKVLSDRQDEAAMDFDGVPVTWGEANAMAAAVERALDECGLAERERVGLMGRNRPAHHVALWAIFISNRCVSMVYSAQPPAALAEDLMANRWPVVFGEPKDWTPEVIAAADAAGAVGFALTGDAAAPLKRVTHNERPGPGADRSPDDDTVIQLLSSGTTGKPKRISLSRTAVDEMIDRTVTQYSAAGDPTGMPQIMVWPLSSLGGTNASLPSVLLGQRLVIQERFNGPRLLDLIRRHRPQFLSIPPSAIGMLLQLKPSKEDLSSITVFGAGSAPLDPNVHAALEDDYGIPVTQVYGATEFAGIISGWTKDDFKLMRQKRGSVGRALPGMTIRTVDRDTGEPLPPGQTGLVEAMVPRIGSDWVRTNDLGRMDEDGFLYLEGRADDAIIRGGFKIVPEEVAEVLRTHPKVADAALIGIKDDRLGEVPAAAVQRRPDTPAPTAEELDAFLRAKLPPYKVPARFAIVDEIPRTESMKPRREGLRQLFA